MLDLAFVWGRAWAVDPATAELGRRILSLEGIAQLRAVGEFHGAFGRRTTPAAGPRTAQSEARRSGTIAVIPVLGMLTQRGDIIDSTRTTSTAELANLVKAYAADPQVDAMVLEFDTPGGEVYGGTEAAAAVREARKSKPVVGVANSRAASMGYWLASQTEELLVTPSGDVGAIGVYMAHTDVSKKLEAEGTKVTLIYAGKYKVEGNAYAPLDAEASAQFQAEVNRHYEAFVRDVAKGRGVSVDQVRDGFGEGRVLGARQAVEAGMATAVGTLEDAIRRASSLARDRQRATAAMEAAQVDARLL